jgi:hypothetical protein
MKKRKNEAARVTAGRRRKKPADEVADTPETRALAERLIRLHTEVAVLRERAESMDDVSALRRAVELLEQAVALTPVESARHGMTVVDLCNAMGSLYQRTGEIAVIQRGGKVLFHWLNTIPVEDWRYPLYVLAGGVLSYREAITTGSEADEDAAINALEGVQAFVHPGSGVYCTACTYLSDLLLIRYRRTWNLKDLAESLSYSAEVIQMPRAMQGERRLSSKLFGQALIHRYELLRSVSDLDDAIQMSEMVLDDDLSRKEKAAFCSIMATALRYRFNEIGNQADLDKAIDCYPYVMQESVGDEQRAVSMDRYAIGLTDRYLLTNNLADLDNAIASSLAGLNLLPDKSPHQTMILANLGTRLFIRYAATRDRADLAEVVALERRNLELTTANLELLEQLHLMLAQALLNLAVTSSMPADLIQNALDHFASARQLNDTPVRQQITPGLLARQTTLSVVDMEVGALLWLSEIDPTKAPELLRRVLQVGEAAKSWVLAIDMARRPLPRPADVPEELFVDEELWLAELGALDNSEITGIQWEQQINLSSRRDSLQRRINAVWAEIAGTSPGGARYVQMRQSPDQAWLDSLHQRDRNIAFLSLLPVRDFRTGNILMGSGIVVLGILPGMPAPFVIAANSLVDPVPAAARQFEAEVPGDGGLGVRLETWHRPLEGLLGGQTPAPLKQARTLVVSPSRDGHNLPWNLVMQRVGWRAEGGTHLPVVTLPTLAILAPMPAPNEGNGSEVNQPLPQRMPYHFPQSLEEAIEGGYRAAMQSWSGPFVVGNPTSDLPSTETEARAVAALLGVNPLIGSEVSKETVLGALSEAPIIHLAAHAWFDETDALESAVVLADGTISARELVSSFSQAELVVLSACEGGVANRVIGGEITGLAHALLRTGARTIVAALWPVDDDATAFLMTAFYRARQSGVDEATALAQAMQSTSEQPLWKHPYFWSGFVLMQGE